MSPIQAAYVASGKRLRKLDGAFRLESDIGREMGLVDGAMVFDVMTATGNSSRRLRFWGYALEREYRKKLLLILGLKELKAERAV